MARTKQVPIRRAIVHPPPPPPKPKRIRAPGHGSDENFCEALGLTRARGTFEKVKEIIRETVWEYLPPTRPGQMPSDIMDPRRYNIFVNQVRRKLGSKFFSDKDDYPLTCLYDYCRKTLRRSPNKSWQKKHQCSQASPLPKIIDLSENEEEMDKYSDVSEHVPEKVTEELDGNADASPGPFRCAEKSQPMDSNTVNAPQGDKPSSLSQYPSPCNDDEGAILHFLSSQCQPSLIRLAPNMRRAGIRTMSDLDAMRGWSRARASRFLREGELELDNGEGGPKHIVDDVFTQEVFLAALGH